MILPFLLSFVKQNAKNVHSSTVRALYTFASKLIKKKKHRLSLFQKKGGHYKVSGGTLM